MTKPGTGCKDAPKCFAIKLAQATNDRFGASPSLIDDQLIMRRTAGPTDRGELDFIGSKHVDDIKVGAEDEVRDEFVAAFEQVFGRGEIDVTAVNFTNCGLRHIRVADGYTVDQTEYLLALKPIVHADLTGTPPDQPAPDHIAKLFLSLLMAMAYTLQTRVDLCVYVIALQRRTPDPTALDVRQ